MANESSNWADQLGDIIDKAVDSAHKAWDGTEESRSSLMESVRKAANDVAAYATEATEATKAAWHHDGAAVTEPGPAPEDAATADEPPTED